MNTAQEHAFEQANLVTQLIKYADRVIVVESASAPERRAFVKLLADQLPDSIEILSVQAGSHRNRLGSWPMPCTRQWKGRGGSSW
ncbi:MAG: hypothetical protein B7Y58_08865 [Halothiobacillus sp. 35-54-62]|nr:MAG: hypothetical protein B7Y58_08865 [Halothiobacillus sp. 35-54-62]